MVNLDFLLSCLPATMSQVRELGENLFLYSDKAHEWGEFINAEKIRKIFCIENEQIWNSTSGVFFFLVVQPPKSAHVQNLFNELSNKSLALFLRS